MKTDGDCHKIGFTKDLEEKSRKLAKRYGQEFSLVWAVPIDGDRQKAHQIEQWWLHSIKSSVKPSKGEEFFESDPRFLLDCLSEAAGLGEFDVVIKV